MRTLLFSILLLAFTAPAFAGPGKPAEIAPYIHAAEPHGQGTLSRLFITVYDASLWTDAAQWSMQSPFALCLHYHLHFTSRDLAGKSVEEMDRLYNLSKDKAADYNAQLGKLFPAVKDGDTITALYVPHKGITFYYNGTMTGRITDYEFAERFFAIWLSPGTSEPKLRKGLLGNHSA